NCEQLSSLIHELLNLSEIESGRLSLSLASCDLTCLLREIYQHFVPMAKEHGLCLNKQISDGLTLVADANRLRQIINNVLSNAIKYTEKGQVVLRAYEQGSGSTACTVIEVQDTGIGIKESDFDAVFCEYKKVHKVLNKQVDSTGLGLPIAKRLIELHQGSISLTSTPGQGSTFTIYLPRCSKNTGGCDGSSQTSTHH
ncbi:MAG: HAMP domain-containing sensor histidine kinase, partial [Pseudomonadales bacterium]